MKTYQKYPDFLQQQRFAEARQGALAQLRNHPRDSHAWVLLSRALRGLQKDHPDLMDGWYLYGMYQLRKSQAVQQARQSFGKALALVAEGKNGMDPAIGSFLAMLHLADAYRLSGHWVEAKTLYRQVLQVKPKLEAVRRIIEDMDRQIVQLADDIQRMP